MKTALLTTTSLALAAAGVAVLPAASASASVVTTGTYDENVVRANTVDASATFASATGVGSAANVLDVATFTSAVAAANAAGFGGVVGFDALTDTVDGGSAAGFSGFTANYGTKTLSIMQGNPATNGYFAISQTSNSGSRESISGSADGPQGQLRYENPTGNPPGRNYNFTLGAITGGATNEAVVSFGATILGKNVADGLVLAATATFSDGSTVISNGLPDDNSADNSMGDTFYGFTAPAGTSIVSVSIPYGTAVNNAGDFPGLDDVGFVTAVVPVPEPATLSLLGLGGLALLRRRRAL